MYIVFIILSVSNHSKCKKDFWETSRRFGTVQNVFRDVFGMVVKKVSFNPWETHSKKVHFFSKNSLFFATKCKMYKNVWMLQGFLLKSNSLKPKRLTLFTHSRTEFNFFQFQLTLQGDQYVHSYRALRNIKQHTAMHASNLQFKSEWCCL